MDAARRELILNAARQLGAEPFNRLTEAVEDTRKRGRLRYWQDELLELPGVGPVGLEEYLAAFGGVTPLPTAVNSEAPPAPDTHHPRLGEMYRDEPGWVGAAQLPRFAAPGRKLRQEDDPPEEHVRVLIEELDPKGVAPEQQAAISRLMDQEDDVFAAVWGQLPEALPGFDLDTQVICTEVEVSRWHLDGVAYLGFSIDCDGHLEHGLQVVYHPTKGTWWGDWKALNTIEEADNLPRQEDDE
ncbi:unnamed protein product [Gemmata massiliana]|uniref:Uncharacterized protein n=2 Tax=Gemmata massiliana TaxID=1210884 RepID=A0A6P2D4U2_9BACT|nr:unnamed protein product [Gemmata massiliana]